MKYCKNAFVRQSNVNKDGRKLSIFVTEQTTVYSLSLVEKAFYSFF